MTDRLPSGQQARADAAALAASAAAADPLPSTQAEHDAVQRIASGLRCLVCQNQTIADSNATLAVDLRSVIREQMRAGQDEAAIKQYMVQRYGEFILYDPPFSAGNLALWFGPLLFVLVGAWIALRVVRRNRAAARAGAGMELSQSAAPRLESLEERYQKEVDGR